MHIQAWKCDSYPRENLANRTWPRCNWINWVNKDYKSSYKYIQGFKGKSDHNKREKQKMK